MFGGLAQLARAPALQAGGQRFESVILHKTNGHFRRRQRRERTPGKEIEYIDILEAE